MRIDVCTQGALGPGGIDFAAGHVLDIIREADRHIACGGVVGRAEVDGDIFRDIHRRQDPRRHSAFLRPFRGSFALLFQGVRRNLKILLPFLSLPAAWYGLHFHGKHRFYSGKKLHPLHRHRYVALRLNPGVILLVRLRSRVRGKRQVHIRSLQTHGWRPSIHIGNKVQFFSGFRIGKGCRRARNWQRFARGVYFENKRAGTKHKHFSFPPHTMPVPPGGCCYPGFFPV